MSKLQKWCPTYTQACTLAEPGGRLTGATGYAPGLCAPMCPISVLAPDFLRGIPSDNAKILVFPTCLPTTGEGWPKDLTFRGLRFDFSCTRRSSAPGGHLVGPGDILPTGT